MRPGGLSGEQSTKEVLTGLFVLERPHPARPRCAPARGATRVFLRWLASSRALTAAHANALVAVGVLLEAGLQHVGGVHSVGWAAERIFLEFSGFLHMKQVRIRGIPTATPSHNRGGEHAATEFLTHGMARIRNHCIEGTMVHCSCLNGRPVSVHSSRCAKPRRRIRANGLGTDSEGQAL